MTQLKSFKNLRVWQKIPVSRLHPSVSYILISIFCILLLSSISYILNPVPVSASDSNGTIDPSYKYAWGENLGWLNFGCDNCLVHVTDTKVTGYAWSHQYGWLNLSPASSSGVTNNCTGQLGGYAWSSNLGWINFAGASIDFNGKFNGIAGSSTSQTGRIRFDCDNCNLKTDWRQCAIRPSPPQVAITAITNAVVPNITASTIMTNEGTVGAEYPYEWCVVTTIDNVCGGGDDVFYASASKFLGVNESYSPTLSATVPTQGTYYFKLVAHWMDSRSSATFQFAAVSSSVTPPTPSGGGGGGGYIPPVVPPVNLTFLSADFNHDGYVNAIDFSILLYFWHTKPPFKNPAVDINKDGKVDLVDFSILLSQWNKIVLK